MTPWIALIFVGGVITYAARHKPMQEHGELSPDAAKKQRALEDQLLRARARIKR